MDFDHRRVALAIARGRAVSGLVMLVLPGAVGWILFGRAGRTPAVRNITRVRSW